jgi:hypothetical protein
MTITLTANYKESLAPEIVEIVDELVEDGGYELEEVLTVYDYFGDEYVENIADIIDILENTDASKSDLYDFLEEYTVDDLEYFEKYQELREDYDSAAVDAFIALYSVSDLENFEDSYEGYYDNVRDLVEELMDIMGTEIPSWVCIDYEATWECSLRHDYDEENGYYFRNT